MALAVAGSLLIFVLSLLQKSVGGTTFSSRLVHRFSPEVVARGWNGSWPEKYSSKYYRLLLANDFKRQRMKLGHPYSFLYPDEGSQTMSLGNDFGWLHYTWIDIGSPHLSFLVALDTGTDLLWVPCDCLQCAPLSASYYKSLDRDLSEYSVSRSSTSRYVPCSHHLCESGPKCRSSKQQCPYDVQYFSQNTSTSGFLVEDVLHLASGNKEAMKKSVQATVILGCGMKQSGGYLDGIAPDGLLGLGLQETSVPSFLFRQGLIQNSFSLCFDEDDSGAIFFGDRGPANQQSTSLLAFDGSFSTYAVGVQGVCIGSSCYTKKNFTALVDTGSSFTFLPKFIYDEVVAEFDSQVNATIASFDGYPWKYCYNISSMTSTHIPSMKLLFIQNNAFLVYSPVTMIYGIEGVAGFCLSVQPAVGDVATIGQNFMIGYRMVFDRESMKLGWSRSNCDDINSDKGMSSGLPASAQHGTPGSRAVSPAVAGRAPSNPSTASSQNICLYINLLPLLLLLHCLSPKS